MLRVIVPTLASIILVMPPAARAAENALKEGWTKKLLESESANCTEATVKDAWENTKREQGLDPAKPLTAKIRKQLAPEIAALKKLCTCAIGEAAKRYTQAEADASPSDLQSFIADTISKGTCKLEQ